MVPQTKDYDVTWAQLSFQAKYFTDMDYGQIMHSAKMAVKYYKGQLDVIYLYCNKDVTTTSKGYQGVETYLRSNGIEIKPITDQTILEQVMNLAVFVLNTIPVYREDIPLKIYE